MNTVTDNSHFFPRKLLIAVLKIFDFMLENFKIWSGKIVNC